MMKRVYIFQLIFFLFFTKGISQKSNLQTGLDYENEIKMVIKPLKFLEFKINKDNKHNQFKEITYLLIYKDSVLLKSYIESKNNSIKIDSKVIYEKKTIDYINYYFDNFNKYKPKCGNGEFWSDGLVLPPPNYKSKLEGYSNNQWNILGGEYDTKSAIYLYNFSFKSKLLSFKCLNFFKNLKSRKLFNKLKREIEKT